MATVPYTTSAISTNFKVKVFTGSTSGQPVIVGATPIVSALPPITSEEYKNALAKVSVKIDAAKATGLLGTKAGKNALDKFRNAGT